MIDHNKILIIFLSSLFIQLAIFLFISYLRKKGIESNYSALQKIHNGEVPRVGGLLFMSSFFIIHIFIDVNYLSLILPLSIGSLIIFIFSFYEDLKQSLSPVFRLLVLFLGSLIFISFTKLPDINITLLNFANDQSFIKAILFILSLMLLMNGFNFIDGLNGLSSFNFFSILLSVIYIGHFYNDDVLVNITLSIFIISIIIFSFNFPFGKIFLGDSGSYIYALFSGALIIFLFERNSQLPTLLAMVILAYPITEMIFSILRKLFNKYSPLKPDLKHLHHLVFKRINGSLKTRNNLASLLMLPFCFTPFLITYLSLNYYLDKNFYKYLIYVLFYVTTYMTLNKNNS